MRWLLLILVAACLAVWQHTQLSLWNSWAPQLSVALMAWAVVDGDDGTVPLRAFLIGAITDLADPASDCFHAAVFTALAVPVWLLRQLLLRTHPLGWAGVAVLLSLLVTAIDAALSGVGDLTAGRALARALLTGLAAVLLGWLLGGLPGRWRPVAAAGA